VLPVNYGSLLAEHTNTEGLLIRSKNVGLGINAEEIEYECMLILSE